MISVLNRRQPLSGNKLFLLIFFCFLSGLSCSASRLAGVPANKPDESENIPPDKVKQEIEREEQKRPRKQQKQVQLDFHVGVFLPFSLNQEPLPNSRDIKVFESVSDYYLGLLLALDHLKEYGMNITLHVYDTRQDSAYFAGLLSKPEMPSFDLVIGPLNPERFSQTSQFFSKFEIPVVAPFALPEDSVVLNPNSFYCSPPLQSYGLRVAKYLKEKERVGSVLYFSDGSPIEKMFRKGFDAGIKGERLTIIDRSLSAGLESLSLLANRDSLINYVIVPSDKERQVNAMLRSFKEAEDKNYLVQVIGLDSWLNFRDPEMDHWRKLNAVLVTGSYASDTDSNYKAFYFAFRQKNKIPPSDYALKGYDQMLFFGRSLLGFGKSFPAHVRETRFEGVGSDFYWKSNNRVLVNQAVRMLHYSDNQFKQQR